MCNKKICLILWAIFPAQFRARREVGPGGGGLQLPILSQIQPPWIQPPPSPPPNTHTHNFQSSSAVNEIIPFTSHHSQGQVPDRTELVIDSPLPVCTYNYNEIVPCAIPNTAHTGSSLKDSNCPRTGIFMIILSKVNNGNQTDQI